MSARALPRISASTLRAPARRYATVQPDLYHIHKPPSPVPLRPQPNHHLPTHTTFTSPRRPTLHPHPDAVRRLWLATSFGAILFTTGYILFTSPPSRTESPESSNIKPGVPVTVSPLSQEEREKGVELIPSGTSSVPPFPRTLRLPGDGEYALVGLGIRTVSFLSIQVYVVGFYIHSDDLSAVHRAIMKRVDNAVALTATETERAQLRELLLEDEKVWEELLDRAKFRSAFRIVPTRNTDFQHLRDGWVRGIQLRSAKAEEYNDPRGEFASSLSEFKALFGGAFKKSVPKQKTLLLHRDGEGVFGCYYDPTGRNDGGFGGEGEGKQVQMLGEIKDYRIAKALWLCYLAGKKVASEPARQSVVNGMLDLVTRPAATLGTASV